MSVHKYQFMDQHNKFYHQQDNNQAYQHIHVLMDDHKYLSMLNIIIHINVLYFYHNMDMDIIIHNIYLYCLHMFVCHLNIMDNQLHNFLLNYQPICLEGRYGHISSCHNHGMWFMLMLGR